MSDRTSLAAVLSEFARTLLSDAPVQDTLDQLVHHAVELLPIDAAGVTLISPRARPRLVAGSDESAVAYEHLQSELNEGPCRAANFSEDPILVPDLATEARFPQFAQRARAAGLQAAFAFPLRSASRRLGALDLYRTSTGGLDEADLEVARTLADVATCYLLNAEARHARTDFVASVSHELRTPMTSVIGYGELLANAEAGPLTPEQHTFVEAIVRNGRRAAALAGDLLIAATVESGPAQTHQRVDLVEVTRRAEQAFAPVLEQRGVVVDYDLPAGPVHVEGVAEDLERVVVNLVGNAVKFSHPGGRVHCLVCHVPPTGHQPAAARIEVRDHGWGIPVEEQSGLFARFFRSSTAEEHQIQGTGLGLSIVESIVHQHGGQIEVASQHLRGSTFTVNLPPIG